MLYTDTMVVTASPLSHRDNFGWDEWHSSFGWSGIDYRGDLQSYYYALIDESGFFEYGPEYDILEIDESIFTNSKDSEENRIRMQTRLKEHIENQKLMLEHIEDSEEWKFLENPEENPYIQYIGNERGIKEKNIVQQNIKIISLVMSLMILKIIRRIPLIPQQELIFS
ncbi:TPA: hypothetical protein ACKROV_000459 [Providencia alcalifaciens]